MKTGLSKALDIAGGKSAVARYFKISPQAVDQWREIVPIKYLFELEKLTGVSREELRPDLYLVPRPKKAILDDRRRFVLRRDGLAP
jgi:DNA-binding transcriptional regulator YdaS (Cro superfamily)